MQDGVTTSAVITAIGVIGTWIIAIAVIWGEKIRSLLIQPKRLSPPLADIEMPAGTPAFRSPSALDADARA